MMRERANTLPSRLSRDSLSHSRLSKDSKDKTSQTNHKLKKKRSSKLSSDIPIIEITHCSDDESGDDEDVCPRTTNLCQQRISPHLPDPAWDTTLLHPLTAILDTSYFPADDLNDLRPAQSLPELSSLKKRRKERQRGGRRGELLERDSPLFLIPDNDISGWGDVEKKASSDLDLSSLRRLRGALPSGSDLFSQALEKDRTAEELMKDIEDMALDSNLTKEQSVMKPNTESL